MLGMWQNLFIDKILISISTTTVEITGNPKAVMHYVNYEEQIVLRYGIQLRGWTYETFKNPSELSSSLPPLRALFDAINNGTCKFVKLTAEEKKGFEKDYNVKVQSGEITTKKRKRRTDAGTKKSKRRQTEASSKGGARSNGEDGEGSENDGDEGAVSGFKSSELVHDDDDD